MTDKRTQNCSFTGLLYRVLLMSFLWWALTDGNTASLWVGVPFAAAAAVFWCFLSGPVHIRIPALARFFIFFAWQSLLAGTDVALRVMRPGLPIDPAMISLPFRLPEGPSRFFLVGAMNLLPGTLSVKVAGDMIEIHVLDKRGPVLDKVRLLENRVAAVFGHAIA